METEMKLTDAMKATLEHLQNVKPDDVEACTKCDGSGELIPDVQCDRCEGTGIKDHYLLIGITTRKKMETDVCTLCGSPERNFKHDHLREVYKIRQDKLDNHQFCPRLTQDEMDSLQRGTSLLCSNRRLCRKRQLENIKKKNGNRNS